MTATEHAYWPSAAGAGVEGVEFVTLVGEEYVCVHLEEEGWKRKEGRLDPTFPRWAPLRVQRRGRTGPAVPGSGRSAESDLAHALRMLEGLL
jgi:hypothetical protein